MQGMGGCQSQTELDQLDYYYATDGAALCPSSRTARLGAECVRWERHDRHGILTLRRTDGTVS